MQSVLYLIVPFVTRALYFVVDCYASVSRTLFVFVFNCTVCDSRTLFCV